jgi:hypothetical protein
VHRREAALDAFADRAADGARIVLVADVVAAVPLPLASPAIGRHGRSSRRLAGCVISAAPQLLPSAADGA